MIRCVHCKELRPERFVQAMSVVRDGEMQRLPVDPSCALLIREEITGVPASEGFQGEIAQDLYDDFLEWQAEVRLTKGRQR